MKRNLLFYGLLLLVGLTTVWYIMAYGMDLPGGNSSFAGLGMSGENTGLSLKHFTDKLLEAPGIFILQLIVIMIVARIMGYLFQLIGQPLVIGEIIAGLILGPSVLGALAPHVSEYLFPEQSIEILRQFSQLGLIFFMFIIGMELDLQSFRKTANKAVLISVASIAFPFISGIIIAIFLYRDFSSENIQFASFALFMGTTLCITAFPILARIVQEKKLTKTPVGNMAISAAAIGDVIGWCILAVVIAIIKSGGISNSLLTIALSVLYIVFMFKVVKPFLYRMGRVYASRETMGKPIVALVFLIILISTLIAEAIGINALFGSFMAGVVMPENLNFKRIFTEKIEDVSLVILLPLFFVATGLRTEIGLINTGSLWLICGLIILVATLSKFGGTVLASKYVGLSWNHSLMLGVLMNSRGLMELIVLNIGYDLGLLSPELFTMLVLMALTTTLVTGPGLNLIQAFKPRKIMSEVQDKSYKIMLSFANPKTGGTLLNLSHQIMALKASETLFTALHLSPRSDLSPENAKIFEKESFVPIRRYAEKNDLSLNTIYRNTREISAEIIRTCSVEKPDILIVGSARTIFSTDILGGVIKKVIRESSCDVLVFNERNFAKIGSILIIHYGNGDDFLFSYASLLNHNSKRKFYLHNLEIGRKDDAGIIQNTGIQIESVSGSLLDPAFLRTIDLVMVSEKNWKTLESQHNLPVNQFPSLLIIHKTAATNRLLNT